VAQALSDIKTHLARVDDLFQDYLALVRVSAGPRPLVDLQALVTQFAQELTPTLTAQGVTVQLDGLEQLGMVVLHAHTFHRALLNLAHNAMDAMPQGGTLHLAGRRQEALGSGSILCRR
jgi:two-component system sporulation sensor kinase B